MNVHVVSQRLHSHFSGWFDLKLHGVGVEPNEPDHQGNKDDEKSPDVLKQMHFRVVSS